MKDAQCRVWCLDYSVTTRPPSSKPPPKALWGQDWGIPEPAERLTSPVCPGSALRLLSSWRHLPKYPGRLPQQVPKPLSMVPQRRVATVLQEPSNSFSDVWSSVPLSLWRAFQPFPTEKQTISDMEVTTFDCMITMDEPSGHVTYREPLKPSNLVAPCCK